MDSTSAHARALSLTALPAYWVGARATRLALACENAAMLNAIDACERAAIQGQELQSLAAFHRWLSQGTEP